MTRGLARLAGLLLAAGAMVTTVACVEQGGDESGDEPGDTGTAQIAISQVPTDGTVGCIAVTATGSYSVTHSEDVAPGQSTFFEIKGLPVGTVSFTGDAFPGPCAAVTPQSTPSWISDPVLASVTNGQPVQVNLVMKKNGKANVGVDFPDDPACSADGAPCLAGAECCSQSCVANVCESDGPPPTCNDTLTNGTETDVDCGGSCAPCASGKACQLGSDCQSGTCVNGICAGCQTNLDCPVSGNECQTGACLGGTCAIVNVPFGTPLSSQTAGDCAVLQCDGGGSFFATPDDTDVPVNDNQCVLGVCAGGASLLTPLPAGTACNQNGGTMCDGNGTCM